MAEHVIVAGVDGSPGGDHALAWAVRRAARTGATVRAVMSWNYPGLLMLPAPIGQAVPPPEVMSGATEAALATVLDGLDAGDVAIEPVVRQGAAASVLVAEATETGAELLVVGTRGRGRMAGVLLGSVSRRVAGAAPCPVAVIPGDAPLELDGPVVVGVDGSFNSIAALRWAGVVTDGPIVALHVFEYPFGPEYAVPGLTVDDPEDFGRQVVRASVTEALGDRAEVTTRAVRGEPREVLAEASRDASMLVVGARGATGLEGFVLGSVTTAVAGAAHVPVVVVPEA